ncbi:unnamed protein product [Soboliphyme baturini]|uniref:ABC-type xenobiotic transporter n=1 Tax=Soboliphyme baturini TaxID=241478 RepID=A0A183IIE8_9BILA|nr:unnamed protein product [Soboliphyme baturini]
MYDSYQWHQICPLFIGHAVVLLSMALAFVPRYISYRVVSEVGFELLQSSGCESSAVSPEPYVVLRNGGDGCSWHSKLCFYWTTGLMKKGYLRQLRSVDDLFRLPASLSIGYLQKNFVTKLLLPNLSLLKKISTAFGGQFYPLAIMKLVSDACTFISPFLLGRIVTAVSDTGEEGNMMLVFSACLVAVSIVGATFALHFDYRLNMVTNFMSIDCERVVNFCNCFHQFWSLPLQIFAALYLLYRELGVSFVGGVGVAVAFIPLNHVIAVKIGRLSTNMLVMKDRRIRLMTEILFSIRAIKFCCWEKIFYKKANVFRKEELRYLKKRKYLDALCVYLWVVSSVIMSVLTFSTYYLLGNRFTASKVFTSLALFNVLITPLNAFPWVVCGAVDAWISLKRLDSFFDLSECSPLTYYDNEIDDKENLNEVVLSNISAQWIADHPSTSLALRQINLTVKKGELVGITGPVGAGKSSLLYVLLGEMNKLTGKVTVDSWRNGVSFLSQDIWLQHGTVRDNIVLHRPFDREAFEAVINACVLDTDIQVRRFVSDKSLYLLDDPFSGVDAQVAKVLFERCFLGLLRGKTVLLVTHNQNALAKSDRTVVMENGRINVEGILV